MQDFSTTIKNICTIKKLALLPKSCQIQSILTETEDGLYAIKLSHVCPVQSMCYLFSPGSRWWINTLHRNGSSQKMAKMKMAPIPVLKVKNCTFNLGMHWIFFSASTEPDEIDVSEWPVAEKCKNQFEDLLLTHAVVPIPAYSTGRKLILPTQYEHCLPGAVIQVKFGVVCHYFRSHKKAVFTTVLCDLFILKLASNVICNPLKCQHEPAVLDLAAETPLVKKALHTNKGKAVETEWYEAHFHPLSYSECPAC